MSAGEAAALLRKCLGLLSFSEARGLHRAPYSRYIVPRRAPKRGLPGGKLLLTFIFCFRQVAGSPFVWFWKEINFPSHTIIGHFQKSFWSDSFRLPLKETVPVFLLKNKVCVNKGKYICVFFSLFFGETNKQMKKYSCFYQFGGYPGFQEFT